MHYDHWQRHGDPERWVQRPSFADRFWAKVDKTGNCWLWTAYRSEAGYGQFAAGAGRRGDVLRAHRVAWELINGAIPEGMSVCHRCDNPPCVNPGHLFLAPHEANMRDKASKNRAYRLPREANHAAKLTLAQAEDIKARYGAGGITQKALGAEYGITQAAVSWLLKH